MQIDHTLTINASVDRVWPLLQRPEAVVESLPGVTLTSIEGEDFTGAMSVGLGPMRLKYAGEGTLRYDGSARAIHIEARGSETRGAGSAAAIVDVAIEPGADDSTRLDISIDLDLQGKPAQFGRGILSEVVTRLAKQFGRNLEHQVLVEPEESGTPDGAAPPTQQATPPLRHVPSAPPATASSVPTNRQLIGIAAGIVIGAAVTRLVGSRRAPSVHLTIIGSDDPAWLDLAREIARR